VHRAVKLARLEVLVVDVSVQMGLGAEPHRAACMRALVWPVVVALVMIQLVDLVEHAITLVAGKRLVLPWR
jgi:hypothetical protein